MMAAKDVVAVGGALLQLLRDVQTLGNNYYRASDAWNEFPSKVTLLIGKHAALKAQLDKYGLSEDLDADIREALGHAKGLLEDQQTILEERRVREANRCRGSAWISACCGRVGEMVFPAKVGSAIDKAIDAYDRILAYLRSQQENEQTMRTGVEMGPSQLSFGKDRRDIYVPREEEASIRSALEDSGRGIVVLLYGGPGSGKSTLARQVGLTYQADKSTFSHVVMLECGHEFDFEATKLMLLQKLGWNDIKFMMEASSDQSLQNLVKANRQHTIDGRLRSLLKSQKLLIILDDLWKNQFLQSLLNLSGPKVAYLVTCQREDLCQNLNCKSIGIKIGELQQEDSQETGRRMLAVHAGFSDGIIPDHLENIAGKVLDQAKGIPLVIATLGAQIGEANRDDLDVWRDALKDFLSYLNHDKPSMYIHGKQYLKSYWSALRQSIHCLGDKEKNLLFLLGMCKGPLVHQNVLHIFYGLVFPNCNRVHFFKWKEQLKSRQLVLETGQKLLSIHDLTKAFIAEQMRENVESIGRLFEQMRVMHSDAPSSEKSRVLTVLVCLYLDTNFSRPVAAEMGHTLATFSETKRRTIEPITELLLEVLLQLDSSNTVTDPAVHMAARQVFLKFICNSALDHHHISQLLVCTQLLGYENVVMKVLQFLENAALLERSFWQEYNISDIRYSLVRVFQDTTRPNFQVKAAMTLAALCAYNMQTRDNVEDTSGMLHQVVQSLAQDQDPQLQTSASLLVLYMAASQDSPMKGEIARFPNLLESLRDLLSKGQNPDSQKNAAWALHKLGSGNQAIKESIFNLPGLVDDLIKWMDQDQNPSLAKAAVTIIQSLADTTDSTMKGKIICFPNLLQSLGASLSKGHNPSLQKNAAWALASLGRDNQSIGERIFDHPRLLDNLIDSVRQDENLGLAKAAVMVILRMAATKDLPMKSKIASVPNLLESLEASLSKDQNPSVQRIAGWALEKLALGNQSTKERIFNFPSLLDKLIQCVNQDQNSGLAEAAVTVIENLAATEDSTMKGKMAYFPNLLESLRASLSKGQKNAGSALANLGLGDQSIKEKVLNFPGMLDTLVGSVDQPVLAEPATKAILTMVSTEDSETKGKIACFPKLLESLGASLSKNQNPALQTNAVQALASLGFDDQSIKQKILNVPGLLDSLVKLRDQDQNSDLAEQAATTIQNLT